METNKTDNGLDNRFQIKDMPGESGKVIGSFATREASDEALLSMRKEDSVQSASYVIVDVGVQAGNVDRAQVAEAAKTAQQKEAERLALEEKNQPTA